MNSTGKPYLGLRAFSLDDHAIFFGRSELKAGLIKKLIDNRFLAIIGDSGSGKSSLAKAGVEYELSRTDKYGKWHVAEMRPEDAPMRNLANTLSKFHPSFNSGNEDKIARLIEYELRRSYNSLPDVIARLNLDGKLMLLIDQFEELFRYKKEGPQGRDDSFHFVNLFLNAVNDPASSAYILITMRSEFLGSCSEFPGLPEAISESQFVIPRLTREQYRQVIVEPASKFKVQLTNSAASLLLNDIEDEKDQLPLLQHALMRVWESFDHKGDTLDNLYYNEGNKISEALNTHAEDVYNQLSEDEKKIAEVTFRSITELGAENKGVRRPQTLKEIVEVAGEKNRQQVITVLDKYREEGVNMLRPFSNEVKELNDDNKIDITHEALMRTWKTLKVWVRNEATDANQYKQILAQAEKYYNQQAEPLTGLDLAAAVKLRDNGIVNEHWSRRYNPARHEDVPNAQWQKERFRTFFKYIKLSEERFDKQQELEKKRVVEEADTKRKILELETEKKIEAEQRLAADEKVKRIESEEALVRSNLKRETQRRKLIIIAFSVVAISIAMGAIGIYKQRNIAIANAQKALENEEKATLYATEADSNAKMAHLNEMVAIRSRDSLSVATLLIKQEKERADSNAEQAQQQKKIAEMEADNAQEERVRAENNAQIAEKQADSLRTLFTKITQAEDTIKTVRTEKLITITRVAEQLIESDPTLSFRLAEYVYKKDSSNSVAADVIVSSFYSAPFRVIQNDKDIQKPKVVFSSNGKAAMVYYDNDSSTTFWALQNPYSVKIKVSSAIEFVDFLNNGSSEVVIVEQKGGIYLFEGNPSSFNPLGNSKLQKLIINGAISPQGNRFVLTDGISVEAWETKGSRLANSWLVPAPKNRTIDRIYFSTKDYNWVMANLDNSVLVVYDANTGKEITKFEPPISQNFDPHDEIFYGNPPQLAMADPNVALKLVNENKIFGKVWELDDETKKEYGLD